jgi:hypothetical protein
MRCQRPPARGRQGARPPGRGTPHVGLGESQLAQSAAGHWCGRQVDLPHPGCRRMRVCLFACPRGPTWLCPRPASVAGHTAALPTPHNGRALTALAELAARSLLSPPPPHRCPWLASAATAPPSLPALLGTLPPPTCVEGDTGFYQRALGGIRKLVIGIDAIIRRVRRRRRWRRSSAAATAAVAAGQHLVGHVYSLPLQESGSRGSVHGIRTCKPRRHGMQMLGLWVPIRPMYSACQSPVQLTPGSV